MFWLKGAGRGVGWVNHQAAPVETGILKIHIDHVRPLKFNVMTECLHRKFRRLLSTLNGVSFHLATEVSEVRGPLKVGPFPFFPHSF